MKAVVGGVILMAMVVIVMNELYRDKEPEQSAGVSAVATSQPSSDGIKVLASVETTFRTGTDEFVFAIGGEPGTLDPALMSTAEEAKTAEIQFEGLLEYGLDTQLVPGVAESWTVSPDGLTYTFKLRQNAKWSNGDAVTAEDFKYSWLRALNPQTASEYAFILWSIKGAKEYNTNKGPARQVGIRTINPFTLEVTLAYVSPFFLELTAFTTYRPVHRKTVETHGDKWTRPENIVTNGPFVLRFHTPQAELRFEANPHYWDDQNVGMKRIVIKPVQEASTVYNLYESGEIDWTGTVDPLPARWKSVQDESDSHQDPYLRTYYYIVSLSDDNQLPVKVALQDERVRHALSLAIDREALLVAVVGAQPLPTFVPTLPGYSSKATVVEFDPDKAKALLNAGYADLTKFPLLHILYNTNEVHRKVAEVVQQMWQKNLGIQVELVNVEGRIWNRQTTQRRYEVARMGWLADYADPLSWLEMYHSETSLNNTGWKDSTFDGLLAQANREPDQQRRMGFLADAEDRLMRSHTVIPLFRQSRLYRLNPAVKGFAPNPLDHHPFKFISKDKKG